MFRRACAAAVLAFAACAAKAEPNAEATGTEGALQGQQRFCQAEADKLKQAVEKLNAGKAELLALLAKAKADAQAKAEGKSQAPAPAPTDATQGPVAPAVSPAHIADDVKLVDTLQQAAVAHQAAAAQALAAAARAPDPDMQRFYLKEATQRMESARNALTRAESVVGATQEQAAPRHPPRVEVKEDWPTLRLLRQTAGEGENTGRFDARGGLQSFAPAPVKPGGTAVFGQTPKPEQFDSARGVLRLSDGRNIDVAPLQKAVVKVHPEAAKAPLFVPDAAAGGALRPAPAVRELLASPQGREQLQQVGGVALEVTFDTLSFAQVADFRGGGARTQVEQPVLVSLGQLLARLTPYAQTPERWAALPQSLRYPGSMRRLHGFVLDPVRQDIFLLGARTRDPDERLDVDALVLAAQAVWREGRVPAVSLDPLPDDPAGPQYPRVHNVPADSVVARVMLDADYAMKRIMLGALDPGVPGYRSGFELMADAGGESRDRFWFHPVPLGMNALRASASGRTWLFDARLQVLTENQWLRDGVLADSGAPNAAAREEAEEFTAYLERFALAETIAPRRIFVRLQGMLDAVAVARLWRELHIDYPVLADFARMPYRRLSAPEERVPAFYPGIYMSREVDDGTLFAAGGVQLRLRPRAAAVDRYADPVAQALEAAVSGFPDGDYALPIGFSVSLARGSEQDASALRDAVDDGRRALEERNYDLAVERFREAAGHDPLDADVWTQLALAESARGDVDAARAAVSRALALEPSDPQVRVTAFEVERAVDPRSALAALDAASLRALGEDYVAAAFASLYAGDRPRALRLCNAALDLDSNNAEALMARFLARPESDASARRRDVVRAIRAWKEAMGKPEQPDVQKRLAFALTMSAAQRAMRTTSAVLAALATPDKPFDINSAVNDLAAAAAEAREARALDPDLPLAPALEAMARGVRVALLRAEGLEAETVQVKRLLDETITRFPQHPAGFYARAVLFVIEEDPGAARAALDRNVELDPTDGRALGMRALVNGVLGDCDAARRDFDRARTLRTPFPDDFEHTVRECGGG